MKTLSAPGGGNHFLFTLIFLLVFTLPIRIKAGGFWLPAGGRQAGLNHCSVALSGFWSVENNVAGMTGITGLAVGTDFQNGYLSSHLGTAGLAVVYPAPFGNLGLSLRYFGYSLFHQTKMSLSYARSLGKKIQAGVQLSYLQTAFGDIYGRNGTFTFGLGMQSAVTKNLTLGLYVYNPFAVKTTSDARNATPSIFRLGLAYLLAKDLLVTVEAEKTTFWHPVVLRAGVEYRFRNRFFFRTGVATSGDVFSFGFGWHQRKLQVDLASTMHPSLGFSPQISLNYSF